MHEKLALSAAWHAKALKNNTDWQYRLSAEEIAELDAALHAVQDTDYLALNKATFQLPQLSSIITDNFLEQLEQGTGCVLLRGLAVAKYSDGELEKLLYGLGLHFGTLVYQTVSGEKLHKVFSQHIKRDHPQARGTNTSFELGFHNDPCDVAALMCVRQAAQGGATRLVSSVAIHNKMLMECPELLAQLYRPYKVKTHRVNTTAAQKYHHRPIFAVEDGHFTCNFLRPYIDAAYEEGEMSDLQREALDVFEAYAKSDELCHEFYLQPGDILFVNNFMLLHARTAFEDGVDVTAQRLLLRLWLSVHNSRPLPQSYLSAYRDVRAGAVRGGFLPEVS